MPDIAYSPLDLNELAKSIVGALLGRPCQPLPPDEEFEGCGLYAIYYHGDLELYDLIARANKGSSCSIPIYVGRAVPSGSRKGEEDPNAPVLSRRLREHAESVGQVNNLDLRDFRCKYLVTDPIWIPLGERLLIQRYRPVWNVYLDGFGNHDPGGNRAAQRRSPWDTVHPGRPWALKLSDCDKSEEELCQGLRAALAAKDRG